MVRAILDGRKVQTRRVVKPQPTPDFLPRKDRSGGGLHAFTLRGHDFPLDSSGAEVHRCPYGVPGDRLWVRETFALETWRELFSGRPSPQVHYRAGWQGRSVMTNRVLPDGSMEGPVEWCEPQKAPETKWRSPIFMPRSLSRLTLSLAAVRVQRVQDISEEDARAEGVWGVDEPYQGVGDLPSDRYRDLWDSINGKRPGCAWKDNPWAWALTFRRLP